VRIPRELDSANVILKLAPILANTSASLVRNVLASSKTNLFDFRFKIVSFSLIGLVVDGTL
jgi:hypothetical protein